MEKFNIRFVADHLVINTVEGSFLVDTGSPLSFSATRHITLGGRTHDVAESIPTLSVDMLRDQVSPDIVGLIGWDLLRGHTIKIDYPQSLFIFDYEGPLGTPVPTTWVGLFSIKVPALTIDVEGQQLRMALDTGAPTSYIQSSAVHGHDSVGTADDFYPILGRFTTHLYEFPTTLCGTTWTARYGVLPSILQMNLKLMGLQGAIGKTLLDHFAVVFQDDQIYATPAS